MNWILDSLCNSLSPPWYLPLRFKIYTGNYHSLERVSSLSFLFLLHSDFPFFHRYRFFHLVSLFIWYSSIVIVCSLNIVLTASNILFHVKRFLWKNWQQVCLAAFFLRIHNTWCIELICSRLIAFLQAFIIISYCWIILCVYLYQLLCSIPNQSWFHCLTSHLIKIGIGVLLLLFLFFFPQFIWYYVAKKNSQLIIYLEFRNFFFFWGAVFLEYF